MKAPKVAVLKRSFTEKFQNITVDRWGETVQMRFNISISKTIFQKGDDIQMNMLIRSSGGLYLVPMEAKLMADQRKIFIEGEINADKALEFIKQLLCLGEESDKPVNVLINTPGGEINSGLLMYDAIVGSRTPVRMICTGRAYSMGAVLFACAKERYMLPNSELMIHQPLLGGKVSGNASSIRSISDSLLETKTKMNMILAKHTGKTEEEMDQATSFDHYFTPEEAVEFGLADRIISFSEIMEE